MTPTAQHRRAFFSWAQGDITEAEPNNEMLKPQSIALPAVVHGQFAKAGDVDSFAFKMKAGQTLVAAMDAYTAGVSMDALMLLRDARRELAFTHDAHSLDPRRPEMPARRHLRVADGVL